MEKQSGTTDTKEVSKTDVLTPVKIISKWDIFLIFIHVMGCKKNGRPRDLGPGAIVNSASQYHGFIHVCE